MKENNFKVLIIEDSYVDFIKIQEKLIPKDYISRLPFYFETSDEIKQKRTQFLRELTSDINNEEVIDPNDCLTKEEKEWLDCLKKPGGFDEAFDRIANTIRENFQELRLIICDLQLCGDDVAGKRIIEQIRQNRDILQGDKAWFCQNIPIICFTHLSGQTEVVFAGINCVTIYKEDVRNAYFQFKSFVKLLSENFDNYYKEHAQRYKVSLSFSGENKLQKISHIAFVKEFAHCLYSKFTKERVFFYVENKDNKDVEQDLENIYKNESEYVIVFITSDYNSAVSPITQREWKAIQEEYEKKNWQGVFFVPIEKEVANSPMIEKLLGINNFNEVFVDFHSQRDTFYSDNMAQAQNDLNKHLISFKEYNEKILTAYEERCEKLHNKIYEDIIRNKMGLY